ncbi:hypothetical protein ACFYW9_03945 [Streptomyces sp. NPDC002698]|uniref:hypothetical protein n=1 Tax=Streptomyces sp. NPDC002698 TaxID=3364660 RepID=UPI0036B1A4C2
MTTPDRLDTWSIRIAERAAPGESGFAAQTARAYAAGGAPRSNLFSSPGQAPGGMGGGAVAVLPAVLDGLAYAAESLKSALGSPELNNLLSATGLLVGLRAQRRAEAVTGRQGEDDGTALPDGDGTAGPPPAPLPGPPSSPPSPGPPPSPRVVPGDDRHGGGDRDGGADGDDEDVPAASPGAISGALPGTAVPSGGAAPGSAAPTADVVRAALRMSGRLRARGLAPAEADELTARLIARLVTEDDPEEAAAFLDVLVGDEPPPPLRGPGTRCGKLRRLRSAASGLLLRAGRPRTTPHGPRPGPEGTNQG